MFTVPRLGHLQSHQHLKFAHSVLYYFITLSLLLSDIIEESTLRALRIAEKNLSCLTFSTDFFHILCSSFSKSSYSSSFFSFRKIWIKDYI